MNQWGSEGVPFLFIVDFEMKKPLIWKLSEIDKNILLYDFNGVTNSGAVDMTFHEIAFTQIAPISKKTYADKYNLVKKSLAYGDSFLTNLTVKSEVNFDNSLDDLFYASKARYKIRMKDSFLVFSPETFVKICDGKIFSYPMKGTIDASVANARQQILDDQKELAEHVTIVDLIRNDLSIVADQVKVSRFRYIDEIVTNGKTLLQVSSEIAGNLKEQDFSAIGDIMFALLPAGSVSGAPKPKTMEIIATAEGEERGYYTGVAGLFDGKQLDSGVMIRFIEKHENRYFYRSGGGITTQSELEAEYKEVIDKIYVPVY